LQWHGFFFHFLRFTYWQSTNCRANSIGAALGKRKNRQSADTCLLLFAFCYRNHQLILLYWPETEIQYVQDETR
jgi:hypothetical protein